jgi:uncharacterized membrane protein
MAERMGTASGAQNEGQSLGFERVVFFSDAVFAIVITLLVLPLTAELEVPGEGVDLIHEVFSGQGVRMLTFAVGFLVVGQFWIAHHRMFGHLRRADHGLLWFNLVGLMTVAFMPFPTALLGGSPLGADRFPVVFYAVSMTVTSVAFTATWLYAVRRGLVHEARGQDEIRVFTVRSFITCGVFLASIAASFLGLQVAVLFWLVLLPLARVTLVRRRPSPVLLSPDRDAGSTSATDRG